MPVLVPTPRLAKILGQATLTVQAETLGQVMDELKSRLSLEDWQVARQTTWLVNGRAAHLIAGRATRLEPDDQIWLITPAGGG